MRWWPPSLKGKNRLFGKFLLSYFLILLVPLLIGVYAYNKTVGVVREDAAQLNLTVLEQSEEALNRLLTEIRDTVSLLSLDSEVLKSMITADRNWSPSSLYQFSQLQRNELSLLSTNQFFSDLFIYLQKSEAVISKNAIERLDTEPIKIGETPFGEWLEGVFDNDQTNRYLRLENVSKGGATHNYLAYVSTLPAGNSRAHIDGAIIILIDERSIASLFDRLMVHEGAFAYIMNQQNEIIVSVANGKEQLEPVPYSGESGSFLKTQGRDIFVTTYSAQQRGWTYTVGIPADAVFSKAEYIKRINWIIAGIALALGCLIAYLFAYRNSKPIEDLVDSIREFARGEPERKTNEIELLASTVHDIISDNKDMNVKMEQQLPMLQAACLERLLKSGFHNEQEMRTYLNQAHMTLAEEHVGVAILKIQATEYRVREELLAEKAHVKRLWSPELEECWYIHDLKSDKLALIYSFSGTRAEEKLAGLTKQLDRFQKKLLSEHKLMTSIGIGQLYHHGLDLWRSCNEALQALDVQDPDTSLKLVSYETISYDSNHYYYPLDLEYKLLNTIKLGDTEALERLLEHIETQNFEMRKLSPWRVRQLHSEIQGTLLKLSEQAQYLSGTIDFQLDHADLEGAGEALSGFQRVKSMLLATSDKIMQQRSAKQQDMFESMKHYVEVNFADNNLSLAMLASEYQQTESFVSTSFKEYVGMAFSEYLEQLRLNEACDLLKRTAAPIQDIAVRVGYSNDKSFRRAFKRSFGVQPTSFRNQPQIKSGLS
ncbi:helix-turn-helix domain-containing protein [Paenibacillus sp. HB172176]|uniref:helix-turn-helix domain-containing protein n=1 Tax=Paenibacillus sp. HB172176 TaxID=2493690 RepID=UPI00143951AF|nr:helix-turn-helix domain-containing protein [Paenibacillus sp. HB172176]